MSLEGSKITAKVTVVGKRGLIRRSRNTDKISKNKLFKGPTFFVPKEIN